MPEIKYHGKQLQELQNMDLSELVKYMPARQRRSIKRGVIERNKPLLTKIGKAKSGNYKRPIKTHLRDMIVLPEMVGVSLHIYNGKEFKQVMITEEMIGCYFGELVVTRQKVEHSAPGIGATKSSTAIATKAK